MTTRTVFALMICSAALAAAPAFAQGESLPPPAPNDQPVGTVPPSTAAPQKTPAPSGSTAPETKPKQGEAETAPSPAPSEAKGAPAEGLPKEESAEIPSSPPGAEADGRYTFSRVQEGYIRLDNRTGQVTFCGKRAVGWACQLAPEDRSVLEMEITRLQAENAALKREMLARGLPLPHGASPKPPATSNNERPFPLLDPADLDRMKTFVGTVWQRLVDMIVSLQKDVLKRG